jgi:type VI secretion system secreted protein VgrG
MESYVEITVEGIVCDDVTSLRGVERISELYEYELEVRVRTPVPNLATLLGSRATIVLRDLAKQSRTVTGIVAEARVISADTDKSVFAKLVVRPAVYRQRLGRDCWSSQDVKVLDVIQEVLEDYPGPVRYDLAGQYPTYPYRVQYREDDWTYLSRLIEEEGIYYWFDHGDGESELVFADTSPAGAAIDGVPLLSFTPASQMRPDQDAVVEVSFCAAATTERFAARSFDLAKPTVQIAAERGSGRHEAYDAPGAGPSDPAILGERVRVKQEAAAAARAGVSGLATSVRPFPGRYFAMLGHPIPSLNGELFVTAVTVEGSTKVAVSTRFSAIPRDVPFRSVQSVPEAKQPGLQMGVVIGPPGDEVFPDQYGRVRVQLHWDRLGDRSARAGTWMRNAQRGSPGSMLLPRMGWNVATFNEEGGVDAPSLFCRIHDGDHPPEYSLPANMTRVVYKTAATPGGGNFNEIYFEDRAGAEEMFVHASRDMNIRAKNRKSETIKNDSSRQVGGQYELHVTADVMERVMQDQTVKVSGNDDLTVQGRYTKSVSQNETSRSRMPTRPTPTRTGRWTSAGP